MIKYIFISLLLFNNNVYAQQPVRTVKLVQYVFNEFNPGTVKLRSGETYQQRLNYNIITNEMVFESQGKFAAIANPENVDTVTISGRKFIPMNNKFYEVLTSSGLPLLGEYTASVSEPGTSIGYGSTTSTSATASYQSLIREGGAYGLKLPDGFNIIPKNQFYILKDGKLERVGNGKQLSNIFPDKKGKIKDLVKKNNTNFSKREDVAALVNELE